MAAALSLTAGRGGGLIGNLVFGYLVDLNCVVPIVLFAAMLFSECKIRLLNSIIKKLLIDNLFRLQSVDSCVSFYRKLVVKRWTELILPVISTM